METKFNSQICTSREQSERLLELGLKPETADMRYDCIGRMSDTEMIYREKPIIGPVISYYDIPAWSLHRLIEMMPLDVIPEGGFDNCFTLIKSYPKGYSVEYDGFSYYHKENIYDTLIEGIEHLIKEGYFNKDYLCEK